MAPPDCVATIRTGCPFAAAATGHPTLPAGAEAAAGAWEYQPILFETCGSKK